MIIRSHGAPEEKIEQFRQKKLTIIDATCPFVRRIQKIVQNALQKGEFIVIIGESKHPEVIGINGHCQNSGFVVNSIAEIQQLPDTENSVCVVAQTTTRRQLYETLIQAV